MLGRFRKPPLPRWKQLARSYRILAVDMGGVLLKLGQFLSTRVDILPAEVTDELAELQDEVPSAPVEEIIAQIEADFQRPISEIFACFKPKPLGSASLGQAHKARLLSGETVAVKVLRPGIEVVVETDLIAITKVFRWLKLYKPIRQHVDLDWLTQEFTTITRRELDLQAEGRNAEYFAQKFADDPQVYTPKIYWDYTAAHTLTMEDVAYIRIDHLVAMEAVGINRREVAKKLFNLYMEQFHVTRFVHVDPHAGNLFVKPLPFPAELHLKGSDWSGFLPNDPVPYGPNRPFQIVFIDFGMAVEISKQLDSILRSYAIGVGTRDARRIVQSYVEGGSIPSGTDLKRLEEVTQKTIDQFWGTLVGQVKDVDLYEYNKFAFQQYRDAFAGVSFQIRADLLFILRATGILSGMVPKLDTDFDAWAEAAPFARRLLQEEWQANRQTPWEQVVHSVRIVGDILSQTQQGKLIIQNALTPETQKVICQLKQAVNWQTRILTVVGLVVAGMIWHVGSPGVPAVALPGWQSNEVGMWLIILALIIFLWGRLKI
jgi:predicted unusual protein kinase regulating ubiquinone biosynthesis (AarF/ABC1/UbiB family)